MTGGNGESENGREKDAGKEKLIDERERQTFRFVVLIRTHRISTIPKPWDMSAKPKTSQFPTLSRLLTSESAIPKSSIYGWALARRFYVN